MNLAYKISCLYFCDRFDGVIQDLSASTSTRLSGDTVKVDITIPDREEDSEDTAVLLLSISYLNSELDSFFNLYPFIL